jgi:hypothetical protein
MLHLKGVTSKKPFKPVTFFNVGIKNASNIGVAVPHMPTGTEQKAIDSNINSVWFL